MSRLQRRHAATILVAVVAIAVPPVSALGAQGSPTAQQAQQMLQSNPELANQLRQRIVTSGLTPAQIRERLQAEGYPENLLDSYIGGANATTTGPVSSDVFAAVRALGLADSADVAGLMTLSGLRPGPGAAARRLTPAERDSAQLDSLRKAVPIPGGQDSTLGRASAMIFGLNVFRGRTSQFLPNLDGPVDANYRLGPGDRVVLILTGDVELAYTLDVTREGFVVIPQVGQVQVANITLGQFEDLLYTRLGRVYSGVKRTGATTHFSVSVARLRSNQVYVLGDVDQPGAIRISSAGTALSALYASGGPTDRGSLRDVQVRRDGKVVATLDVYDYLLRGDASNDPRLQNGDIVFVPIHGPFVRVSGEVNRPATYEMKDGETLANLIQSAGGFTAEATRRRITIERVVPADGRTEDRERVTVDVDGNTLTTGAAATIPVRAFDVVRVYRIGDRVRARVIVKGNVHVPGAIGISGPTTLSEVLRRAGGPKGDTYLGQVLISRLQPDSSRIQLRASLRDTLGNVVNDVPVQEDDEVTVFSVTGFRPQRFVAIGGAVKNGGQYPWRDGMTLRDLVLMAGGLDEGAYLDHAEVARLPADRSGGATAQTLDAALDSTYLFERKPDGSYAGPPGLPAPASGTAPFALEPYDNVLILKQPGWQLQRTVVLTGEVRFPGRYALQTKGERISDLISHAGGLTPQANADGAFFGRLRRTAAYQVRDTTTTLAATLAAADSMIRIGVDVRRALRDPGSSDNLILFNGDSIDVPVVRNVVDIRGQVNVPGSVAWTPGASLEDYLRAAGGATDKGLTRRAYVVQPNGKIESRHYWLWWIRRDPEPRAGATVGVPVRDVTQQDSILPGLTLLLQTIIAGAATIAVFKR